MIDLLAERDPKRHDPYNTADDLRKAPLEYHWAAPQSSVWDQEPVAREDRERITIRHHGPIQQPSADRLRTLMSAYRLRREHCEHLDIYERAWRHMSNTPPDTLLTTQQTERIKSVWRNAINRATSRGYLRWERMTNSDDVERAKRPDPNRWIWWMIGAAMLIAVAIDMWVR